MGVLYRSMSCGSKVAELYVETPDCILCTLIDTVLKTESKVECCTLKQAEKLVEQFLRPKNYH